MKIGLAVMAIFFCLTMATPLVGANPKPSPPPLPVLSITSPNSMINVRDVLLTVEVKVFAIPTIVINGNFYTEDVDWLNFSIDNKPSISVDLKKQGIITPKTNDSENPFNGDPYELWVGNYGLSDLPDGTHEIIIMGQTKYLNNTLQKYFYFTIDSTIPKVFISSPASKIYYSSQIALNYTIDKSVSWSGYSLDNQANITLNGNTTLSNLSNGLHTLIVYANDTYGNSGSSKTSFTISQEMGPTSTPTAPELSWIILPILSMATLVGIIELKRKHQKLDANK